MNKWAIAVLSAVFIGIFTGSIIYSLCLGLGVVAISFEIASRQAARRHNLVSRCWPEVLDSFSSAVSAGLSTAETFSDLATYGPHDTRAKFALAVEELDRGSDLGTVLDDLKVSFGEAHPDRLFELLRLVNEVGGSSYPDALSEMAKNCRAEIALDGEIAAKQGWISGTAKLAIASPWVIVILLSFRPENSLAYGSPVGLVILVTGLLVSLTAYRLIHILGAMPSMPRVFR